MRQYLTCPQTKEIIQPSICKYTRQLSSTAASPNQLTTSIFNLLEQLLPLTNTLRMKKTILLMSSIALMVTITSCTKKEGIKILPPTPEPLIEKIFPEISLFEDNEKLIKLTEICISSENSSQSKYGRWYSAKDCDLPISISPQKSIKINAFHTN